MPLNEIQNNINIDIKNHRFPFCIVWTPIPILTWLFPFIGHMGIATSQGIIRDFGGSYFVSEDLMSFGWPTKYWQLSVDKVFGGVSAYDEAIAAASNEYNFHTHNICCDNCHSHVAMALNTMKYDGSTKWNMVNLAFYMLIKGKFVNFRYFFLQCFQFLSILIIILLYKIYFL